MAISSVNPATGEVLKEFKPLTPAEITERLQKAERAFAQFRLTSPRERAQKLARAAEIIEAQLPELARLMTLEMGKTLQAATDEAKKCATACRYYVEHGEAFLKPDPVETEGFEAYILPQPLGPVLAVMPWNFPFWQVFRFAAPALMLGNVGLLKHASNVPQCALAIERIFREAGFADGVFQTLLIGSDAVDSVIVSPYVRAVTLTGSEGAGRSVARTAGAHLKKCVLELGGSDPFIVTESADLTQAVRVAVQARIINNGQSCIAAKRFIVLEGIAARFEREMTQAMAALKVGDPLDPATQIGPLATAEIRRTLQDQVDRAVVQGARILTGGKAREGKGNYYEPTVLTQVGEDSPAFVEELFGPVAPIFRARDLAHAVELANHSRFGLGASAWTQDPSEIQAFAQGLEAGMVFINAMVASDPRLPFGGIKHSGYGRELGRLGMLEFANLKSVAIAKAGNTLTGAAHTE